MKRAIGFVVIASLLGGAVWVGLKSERPAAPLRVANVEELAQVLSERGLGCGHVDRDVPGMPPRDADYGVCEIGGHPAAVYVFENSPGSLVNQLEGDFKGGWVVGGNWVVTVHDGALAREVAELLGVEALHGRRQITSQASVPRCSEDIPFEPTYLPEGFRHKQFEDPFPGGPGLEDQSSIGGKPHEEQVVAHYRGSGGRAIEIRRPGTEFAELAQGNDAPTIEVLGSETSGFAPIGPGGDDFIVQFTYPDTAPSTNHCAIYSLNEYGVSLSELKKVAEGLRPQIVGRSGRTFGWGRIPAGDLKPCPRGELSAERPTKQKIRELVAEIVDAANSDRPDPTKLWDQMDRTMRTLYGSFDTFQKTLQKTRLDPVYVEAGVSDQVLAQRRLSSEEALIDIGALCGEAVKDATWMGSAFFPDFEGVSGGAVQLFFVMRPSGPKLWFAY